MKLLPCFLLCSIVFLSYGQETPVYEFSWEPSVPSLSYVSKQEIATQEYTLMVVDLSVDLRRQALHKNVSTITLSENQFISASYKVAIPQNKFRVYGNNGYTGFTPSNGGIKNTAYQDASLYSGAFCPITGAFY